MGLLEAHQWKFNVIFPTGFDLHKGFFCKERIGPMQAGKGDQALCMQHQLVIQGVLQNQIVVLFFQVEVNDQRGLNGY